MLPHYSHCIIRAGIENTIKDKVQSQPNLVLEGGGGGEGNGGLRIHPFLSMEVRQYSWKSTELAKLKILLFLFPYYKSLYDANAKVQEFRRVRKNINE